MKKLFISVLSLSLLGSMMVVPAAQAGPYGHGYYGGHHRGYGYAPRAYGYGGYGYGYRGVGYGHGGYGYNRGANVGGVIAAGVALGLIGAAIAASQQPRYAPAPAYGYYGY